MKLLVQLLVLASITILVKAAWILEARLVYYTNPGNVDFQGHCCDPHTLCISPCDVYFTFCLRNIYTSPTNPGNCQQLVTTTRKHTVATSAIYPPAQGPLYAGSPVSNPIRFYGNYWNGRFQLLVTTEDADLDPDDLIDRNAFNQELPATGAWTGTIRVHGYYQAAHVAMQFKASCDQYYYSQTCTVYCKAQDDSVEGHYNCNSEGGKVCLTGWSDPDDNCLTPICAEGCKNGECAVPGECSCLNGWFGKQCDQCHPGFSCSDSGDVIPNNCLNGATCISHNGECICQCASGWTGDICDTNINDCDSNPCESNGNCTDRLADYQCDCAVGYYGKSCEEHYCDSSPCENGATCSGTADGYICTCPHGVTGTNCSVDIDECATLPCENGGTCVNLLGDYSCNCPNQYRGKNCEYNEQIPQCSPNPCPQGLTCAEGDTTDYVCIQCSDQSSECNIVIEANTTLEDSAMPIGAVVGGIGGGLLLVCLLAIVLLVAIIVYIKRRNNNNDNYQCHVFEDNLSNGTETEHESSDNEPRSISSYGDRASTQQSLASTSTGDNVSNSPSEGSIHLQVYGSLDSAPSEGVSSGDNAAAVNSPGEDSGASLQVSIDTASSIEPRRKSDRRQKGYPSVSSSDEYQRDEAKIKKRSRGKKSNDKEH